MNGVFDRRPSDLLEDQELAEFKEKFLAENYLYLLKDFNYFHVIQQISKLAL